MGRDSFGILTALASLSRRAVAAAWVVLLIGMLASTAKAAGGWSVVPSENLSGPNGQLFSVSCPSASACTAVGTFVKRSGVGVSLAERWDGKRWSAQPTPSPSGASVSILYAVSCTSPSACIAVGRSANSSGTFVTLAERWNGANWSIVRTPNPTGAQGSFLGGVACPSPSACIAVGAATDRDGFVGTGTLVERWNGTSWSILPTPAANGGVLNSVACTSSSACTAVGFYNNTSGVLITLAEHWNGTNWGMLPTPNPSGAQASGLNGVACTSASACTAVGNYNTSSGAGMTLAERWNGTTWSIQPTPNTASAAGSLLSAVSCSSAAACIAVGFATDSAGHPTALAERWNGTTWSIQPTPQPLGARVSILFGVTCTSSSACVAVGNADPGTLAERWNGTRWSVESTHDPLGAKAGVLNGVACRSAFNCTAVGVQAGPLGNPLGTLAERWNGTNWSILPTPNPAGTAGSILTAVTCPSAPACVAVGFASDSFGNPTATLAERWNGTHWSIQPTPNPNGAAGSLLLGVACTSSSACIAVGVSTNTSGKATALAERWNGTDWSIQPTPNPAGAPGSALNGVACPSASVCIAVGNATDSSGNSTATLAERWNGTNWTIQPTPNPTGAQGGFLNSVACPAVSVCTAVGLTFSPFPSTLAERWNGATWKIQSTPRLPGVYDIDPPAVACPSLSNCTAVGGYKNNGLKLTLAERWSPATQDNPPAAPTGPDPGSLGAGCARPSLPMPPPRRAGFGRATVAPSTLAPRPWCGPA